MLREAGGRVVGMDYDVTTLRQSTNVACADAGRLPVADATFDVITSFETLEHVPDAEAMLRELRRVLRPDGTLVLSTPNRSFRESENPYHVQEFTADELRTLLYQYFGAVTIYGQRPSQRYRFVPFLMLEPTWSPAEVTWKLLNRLPYVLKNTLAHAAGGRAWYPSEAEWRFTSEDVDGAHALLAVAR